MQCLLLKNQGGKSINYLTASEINHHPTGSLKEEPFSWNISKSAIFEEQKSQLLSQAWTPIDSLENAILTATQRSVFV